MGRAAGPAKVRASPSTLLESAMSRPFRLAGIIAGIVLIAFGIGAIVIGINGRHEVSPPTSSASRSSARPT